MAGVDDLVCLTMVPGVGPHTCRALLERFGTASAVLDARLSALRAVPGVGPALAERIARARRELDPRPRRDRRAGLGPSGHVADASLADLVARRSEL